MDEPVVLPALPAAFGVQLAGAYRTRGKHEHTFRTKMLAALQASNVTTREEFIVYKDEYLKLAAPHVLVGGFLNRLVTY